VRENFELALYEDSVALVVGVANEAMEMIARLLAEKKVFHIALTGGPLGTEFAEKLVELMNAAGDLSGLNIWFSDERFDAADSPLRNSRPVRDGLTNTSITVHEVASTDSGIDVYEAAHSYQEQLRGVKMDVCILGLGFDGHVASLFPTHWNSQVIEAAIAVADSPKPPAERVSFSMAFINSSNQVWIIASGESKATAAKAVLGADVSVPAGHVQAAGLTRLILDREAFN
jgi:6-phosphogluconolactonase